MSGIFRDVYIPERAEDGIDDWKIDTDNSGKVVKQVKAGASVHVKSAKGENVLCEGDLKDGEGDFCVENPDLWNRNALADLSEYEIV